MKIEITSKALKAVLSTVGTAIPSRVTLPALGFVKLVAKGDTLTVSGTNLDMVITQSAKVNVITEGELAIDPSKIRSLLDNSDTLITIEKDEGKKATYAKIKAGAFKKTAVAMKVSDLPEYIKVGSTDRQTYIGGDLLTSGIEAVIKSVAPDTSDKPIKGVRVEFNDSTKNMLFIAVTAQRLSVRSIPVDATIENFTLPPRTAEALLRIIPEGEEVIIESSDKFAVFKWSTGELRTKVLEGNYPNIVPIIQQTKVNGLHWIGFDGSEALLKIDRVSEVHHARRIAFKGSKGLISIDSADSGDVAKDTFPSVKEDVEKELPQTSINGTFAMDAINSAHSKELIIAAKDRMLAFKTKDGTYLCIIAILANQ